MGYNKTDTTTQINRAISILRNKIKTSNTVQLPLTVMYNRTLPDLKTITDKNWHIHSVHWGSNPTLKNITPSSFPAKPPSHIKSANCPSPPF